MRHPLKYVWVILGIGILAVATYYRGVKRKEELNAEGRYAVGVITEYYLNARGNAITIFNFVALGDTISSLSMKGYFRGCQDNGYCIGRKYLVRYSSVNPKNCEIYFDKPIEGDTIPSQYLLEQP